MGNIIDLFHKSLYAIEHAYTSIFYHKLHRFVSRATLKYIVKDVERVWYVTTNKHVCHCTLMLILYVVINNN